MSGFYDGPPMPSDDQLRAAEREYEGILRRRQEELGVSRELADYLIRLERRNEDLEPMHPTSENRCSRKFAVHCSKRPI